MARPSILTRIYTVAIIITDIFINMQLHSPPGGSQTQVRGRRGDWQGTGGDVFIFHPHVTFSPQGQGTIYNVGPFL